jgi:putative membrane protein
MNMRRMGVIALGMTGFLAMSSFASMSASDVLNDLHKSNLKEIHMGEMAQQKGTMDETRDFGKTLVSDHQSADDKVQQVAQKEGITLETPKKGFVDKLAMKNVSSAKGNEFDRSFAKSMVKDHEGDVKKMQDALKDTTLPQDVRDLVSDVLPTLQKHLELAQKLENSTAAK